MVNEEPYDFFAENKPVGAYYREDCELLGACVPVKALSQEIGIRIHDAENEWVGDPIREEFFRKKNPSRIRR